MASNYCKLECTNCGKRHLVMFQPEVAYLATYDHLGYIACHKCSNFISCIVGEKGNVKKIFGAKQVSDRILEKEITMLLVPIKCDEEESDGLAEKIACGNNHTLFWPSSKFEKEQYKKDILAGIKESIAINELPEIDDECEKVLKLFTEDEEVSKNLVDAYIEEFENLYSTHKSYESYLQNVNAGDSIFCISDYPIEWLKKEGVPLCFFNDVCRLPQYKNEILLKYFENLEINKVVFDEDILRNTWVLMCSPTCKEMHRGYYLQILSFEEMGFHNYQFINNYEQFAQFIKETDVKFLIIDTHGSYINSLSETLVRMGKDYLRRDDVLKIKKAVPLVFFSACFTNPPHKFDSTIADGFLMNGGIAAITTYTAMDIVLGTKMIIRIINNLKFNLEHSVHETFLDFISHLNRSTKVASLGFDKCGPEIMNETIQVLTKVKSIISNENAKREIDDAIASNDKTFLLSCEQAMTEHFPETRKLIYDSWEKLGVFEKSELMLYSNLGCLNKIKFRPKKS